MSRFVTTHAMSHLSFACSSTLCPDFCQPFRCQRHYHRCDFAWSSCLCSPIFSYIAESVSPFPLTTLSLFFSHLFPHALFHFELTCLSARGTQSRINLHVFSFASSVFQCIHVCSRNCGCSSAAQFLVIIIISRLFTNSFFILHRIPYIMSIAPAPATSLFPHHLSFLVRVLPLPCSLLPISFIQSPLLFTPLVLSGLRFEVS
jgi:hypothetical protein